MKETERYKRLLRQTKNTCLLWKYARGFASDKSADLIEEANLNWISDLTLALEIWIDKGEDMTDGELILARANLGSVVESWIRLFLSIYIEDYDNNRFKNPKGNNVRLKDMSFCELQIYFCETVLGDNKYDEWLERVRLKRNAIHSFKNKDIGTSREFICDVYKLCDFVDEIVTRLPPIEEYVKQYPIGYELW